MVQETVALLGFTEDGWIGIETDMRCCHPDLQEKLHRLQTVSLKLQEISARTHPDDFVRNVTKLAMGLLERGQQFDEVDATTRYRHMIFFDDISEPVE